MMMKMETEVQLGAAADEKVVRNAKRPAAERSQRRKTYHLL